jgi:hypothetical protein
MQRIVAVGGMLFGLIGLVASCGVTPEPEVAQQARGLVIEEDQPEPDPTGSVDADSPIETDHTFRLLCGRYRRNYQDITGSGYGASASSARDACRAKVAQRALDRTRCDNDRCEEGEPYSHTGGGTPTCRPNSRIYDLTYECRERSSGSGDQRWRCTCEADWARYSCTDCGE